jgi:hypothetical protein
MPTAAESLGKQSSMEAALEAGLDLISADQTVVFTQYQKWVFDTDGSVFWAATSKKMTVKGSLHYATDRLQDLDQTIASNHVLLTSQSEITQFNIVSPSSMWIGAWPIQDGVTLQVAFSQRGNYYQQADIWHYSGFAVYPAMSAQIVAAPADLPEGPIVSNSLPIWLALNSMAPVYPSFLVPDNLVPPYIVAHVYPEMTSALGAFPIIGPWPGTTEPNTGASPLHQLASFQLMRDEVELTLYGFTNQMAVQYFQSLIDASVDVNAPFGFANSPSISDAKRVQVEIAALAQKKTIRILANYYQGDSNAIARRLILSAMVSSVSVIGGFGIRLTGAVSQGEQSVRASGTVS